LLVCVSALAAVLLLYLRLYNALQRREGGGGGYQPREYRGPSDFDNVETFGSGAAG
jgi:hypothetical protein